jgi:hypothetical protein
VDFILAIIIYFLILHKKRKLKRQNQIGDIIYSVKIQIPDVTGSIPDNEVSLPGSVTPEELPTKNGTPQKG